MIEEDLDIFLKLIVVGNGGVGKSSLIQRYCKGHFTTNYKKTIGVDFLEKHLTTFTNQEVMLQIWDTAGQEEFDSLTRAYYRGAHICLLVFSSTDRNSLGALASWKQKVKKECGDILTVVIQNKMDLVNEFEVDRYDVEHICRNLDLKLFRTSVKNNSNIDQVFHYLVDELMNKQKSQLFEEQFQLNTSRSLASIVLPLESKYQFITTSRAEARLKIIKLDAKKKHAKRAIVHKLSKC